jgi:hypothetical protein
VHTCAEFWNVGVDVDQFGESSQTAAEAPAVLPRVEN